MNHTIMVDRRRVRVSGGSVVAGSVKADTVTLKTDSDYDGAEVTLILGEGERAFAKEYTGPVEIPQDLTKQEGFIAVSVVGRFPDGEVVVTEYAPEAIKVVKGGMLDAREA